MGREAAELRDGLEEEGSSSKAEEGRGGEDFESQGIGDSKGIT